jgi:polysulfide reductase-like protein
VSPTSEGAQVMQRAQPRSYYGAPVLKPPVWSWEVPVYFFVGGLAGASAPLALLCELRGEHELARRAWLVSLAAICASPPLLISDLGRPRRFLNMLRVFKPTSPMSVGSWTLASLGGCVTLASAHAVSGRPRRLGRVASLLAGALGPVLCTYTAVLIADTAVPAWSEARRELPFVFAGSAAASAGAAVALVAPARQAGPPRRYALIGAVLELAATRRMHARLGELAAPYHDSRATRVASALTAGGAMLLAGRRRRTGALALLAGSASQRWAVFRAGVASAADPQATIGPQRAGLSGAATLSR